MTVTNVPWSEEYKKIGVHIADESAIGDQTHHEIHVAANKYRERARKAAALDPGLKEEVRHERAGELLRKARGELVAAVGETTQRLKRNLSDLEARRETAGRPTGPADDLAAKLLWQMRVDGMMRQLEAMESGKRGAAIRTASAAGNALPLAALDQSLEPLVSSQLADVARSMLAETVDTKVGALIEAAEGAVGKASSIERQLGSLARTVALDEGVPAEALEAVARPAPLKMTTAEKAEVILSEGLETFKELVNVGGPTGAPDDPPGNAAA